MRKAGRVLGAFSILVVGAVAGGCAGGGRVYRQVETLPPGLPSDPIPCAEYCKVWVPPVYRDVPVLEKVRDGTTCAVPQTVREICYREEMVKPRTFTRACIPGDRCEDAAVEVKAGGWKWTNDGACWKYCYVPPEFQWCPKTIGEESISYCAEQPPEFRVVAESREVVRPRMEYVPPEYRVKWVQECWEPGHWEWRLKENCAGCICPENPPGISGAPAYVPPPVRVCP